MLGRNSKGDFYAALSALVKTIRLRHTEDAVVFLLFLHDRFRGDWYRSARRVLIGAAEDGLSVAAQKRVASWFENGWHRDAPLIDAVREIIRICELPNWWAQPDKGGHNYIFSWEQAERIAASSEAKCLSFEGQLAQLEREILLRRPVQAISLLCCFDIKRGFSPALLGERLRLLAIRQENVLAFDVSEIYLRHLRALSNDTNFVGQAIYRLSCGDLGIQEEIEVYDQKCSKILASARERLDSLDSPDGFLKIPSYLLDGIHSPGRDRRFSGMSSDMAAACRAFTHYGRLDPADRWLVSFRQDGEDSQK